MKLEPFFVRMRMFLYLYCEMKRKLNNIGENLMISVLFGKKRAGFSFPRCRAHCINFPLYFAYLNSSFQSTRFRVP
jgi:hypothetical protein